MPERAGEGWCAKSKRYGEEQYIGILKEEQSGNAVARVCRAHGIMETTVYRWRHRFSGMDEPESRRLNELEDENRRLKALAAGLVMEIQVLEKLNLKQWQRGRRCPKAKPGRTRKRSTPRGAKTCPFRFRELWRGLAAELSQVPPRPFLRVIRRSACSAAAVTPADSQVPLFDPALMGNGTAEQRTSSKHAPAIRLNRRIRHQSLEDARQPGHVLRIRDVPTGS